jgi:hypothetical protein
MAHDLQGSAMTLLKRSARVLLVGLVFCPLLAGQLCRSEHEYPCVLDSFMWPYPVVIQFDQEAKASDPAGIHEYSDDLTWFLVRDQVSKDYRSQLTDRLAKAEQAAREGKGRLIPEADVVSVFNDMMRRVGAPSTVRAGEDAIHAFRQQIVDVPSLPALFSASRNGTYCYPGEAVFLLYTLIVYSGVPPKGLLEEVRRLRDSYAATPTPYFFDWAAPLEWKKCDRLDNGGTISSPRQGCKMASLQVFRQTSARHDQAVQSRRPGIWFLKKRRRPEMALQLNMRQCVRRHSTC